MKVQIRELSRIVKLVCVFLGLSCAFAGAQDAPRPSDETIRQLQAIEAEKANRTPAQNKISSGLLGAIKQSRGQPVAAGAPNVKAVPHNIEEGKVSVDIKGAVTPALQSFIESQGGQVVVSLPELDAMTAKVPLDKLEGLAERPEVKSIVGTPPARRNQAASGLQNKEGDAAHAAATARAQFHTTGAGVKVCVISDSVDHLSDAQHNGSLGQVDVLSGQSGVGLNDVHGEGTAMLEIVHRIAPGAILGFATGWVSPNGMAANILRLADAGCKIIVDDLSYYDESPFQDGVIARAVNSVSDRGVIYFSSAANSGNQMHSQSGTWEGDFVPDGVPIEVPPGSGRFGHLHLFAPGKNANEVTDCECNPTQQVDLFWNDPLGASTNEYDLYVINAQGDIVSSGNTTMQGIQDPHQTAQVEKVGDKIWIFQPPGTTAARFLHLDTNRARIEVGTTGSTHGHNASGAANAFTVAAVSAQGRTQPFTGGATVHVETFSSDGPRRVFYTATGTVITPGNLTKTGGQLLQKPDITAADCVMTDVPAQINGQFLFRPFCGTSAAAPHAAAIAALLISHHPTITPDELRQALTTTSLDIETPGWDEASGHGIVMPGAALGIIDQNAALGSTKK